MIISRENAALPADPLRVVEIPELGGEAYIKPLPLSQHMEMLAALREDGIGYTLELVAATVVLEDGVPLFEPGEWDEFAGRYPATWKSVSGRVLAAVGGVDSAKKNSGNAPSLDSPSS